MWRQRTGRCSCGIDDGAGERHRARNRVHTDHDCTTHSSAGAIESRTAYPIWSQLQRARTSLSFPPLLNRARCMAPAVVSTSWTLEPCSEQVYAGLRGSSADRRRTRCEVPELATTVIWRRIRATAGSSRPGRPNRVASRSSEARTRTAIRHPDLHQRLNKTLCVRTRAH